jgi:molybdenum cofactor cytidylyltransferase
VIDISCIILAAGKSSRMNGRNKLLLKWRGKEIIRCTIESILEIKPYETIVVLGHQADTLSSLIENYPVKIVKNNNYFLGQSTSLKEGLKVSSDKTTGALFMLGDLPLIKKDTLAELVNAFIQNPDKIIVPYYFGKRGNPIIVPRSFFKEIFKLKGDVGARGLLIEKNVIRLKVNDQGVIFDIDNPKDYERLLKY